MNRMRFAVCLPLLPLGLLAISGCAASGAKDTHETRIEHEAVMTVEAIDVPARLVTLRGADGKPFTVRVDESVTDFPRAKVGDRVRVRYAESLALQLKKPGETATTLEVSGETTKPGGTPRTAGANVQMKELVRIEAIDRKQNIVTISGPRGRRAVRVNDPAMQKYVRGLNPGDQVEATYTEALALTLEPVQK